MLAARQKDLIEHNEVIVDATVHNYFEQLKNEYEYSTRSTLDELKQVMNQEFTEEWEKFTTSLDKVKEELNEYCAPFWLKYGKDEIYGGVLNCLDREGKVFSYDKSVWMQGRCAWMYSHLSNLYGKNIEYLSFAKSCIDFLNNYCFDKDGRMYFKVTRDGKPLRKRRYWFSESFYISACIEYYKATKETKYLMDARNVYDLIVAIFQDSKNDKFNRIIGSAIDLNDLVSE